MKHTTDHIDSLSPNQAWEAYVGSQSVREFVVFSDGPIDEAVSKYVADSEPCEGLVGEEYDRVVELLTQHIEANV